MAQLSMPSISGSALPTTSTRPRVPPRRQHRRTAVRVVRSTANMASSKKSVQLVSAKSKNHSKGWWFARRQAGGKRSRLAPRGVMPRPPHNTNDYLMSQHEAAAAVRQPSPTGYASLLAGWTIDPFGSFLNPSSPTAACDSSS